MKYCCVPQCKYRSERGSTIRFHRIPLDKKLKKQWIQALKIVREPSKTAVVCSNHFKSDDYRITNWGDIAGWLKKDAIPSQTPHTTTSLDMRFKKPVRHRPFTLPEEKPLSDVHYIDVEMQGAGSVIKQEAGEDIIMDALMNVDVNILEENPVNYKDASNPSTSLSNEDLRPLKSGEILRDEMGIFSFVCTYCDVVCENCNEIMDHINSHFDKENSFIHEAIEEASPEFISIDEIKTETTTLETEVMPHILKKLTNTMCQPKPINAPSILKSKIEMHITDRCGTNDKNEVQCTPDKSNITKIVKIVKLKPIKFRRRKVIGAQDNKMLSQVDQKDCLTKPTDLPKINTPTEINEYSAAPESNPKSNCSPFEMDPAAVNESDPKSSRYVHTTEIKYECSQPDENPAAAHESDSNSNSTPPEIDPAAGHESDPKSSERLQRKEMNENENPIPHIKGSKCRQCEREPTILNDPSVSNRHICLFCANCFRDHMELEAHIKEVHSKDTKGDGYNNFYCYVCKQTLPFPKNLVSHFKIHIVNTEHLCEICGSKFQRYSSLKNHMGIHEDRTYECGECGKKFKRCDRLRNHRLCHTTGLSFVCKICSKGYKLKKYLDRHMAVHNDVRINCRFCDASFNFATVRNAHEKSRHNVV